MLGLWALISLTMFLWHVKNGIKVRQATQRYERVLPEAPTQILLAGDSVIFGVGASQPETSIAGLFGRDFPEVSVNNIGVSGAETDGLVSQLESVKGQHFSLVVIIIGANDVVHFANLKTSASNLDRALTLATALSERVVLMPEGNMGNPPLFPRLAEYVLTPRSRKFRTSAKEIAKTHDILYVDVFFEQRDDPWRKRPTDYYAGDLFHPADPGYADWYRAIRKGMEGRGWKDSL